VRRPRFPVADAFSPLCDLCGLFFSAASLCPLCLCGETGPTLGGTPTAGTAVPCPYNARGRHGYSPISVAQAFQFTIPVAQAFQFTIPVAQAFQPVPDATLGTARERNNSRAAGRFATDEHR